MPDGTTPSVKKGRKFDQVLIGARDVFLRDGFEGASVDDIAKAAQVSKATLYSYFPDKRLLFMEVAKTECRRQADSAIETTDMTAPIATILTSRSPQINSLSCARPTYFRAWYSACQRLLPRPKSNAWSPAPSRCSWRMARYGTNAG